MLVPPTWSIGTPRRAQRLDHADMGEGARAAAGHDDADRMAGHQARQPVEIGREVEPHVMMLAVQAAGELAGRRARLGIVALVQQHQLAAAMEHGARLRRLDLERQPGGLVVVGSRTTTRQSAWRRQSSVHGVRAVGSAR